MTCPFCGEDGFDLMGVKHHLLMRWCEPFNNLTWENQPKENAE